MQEEALVPKPKRIPLKGLPASAFQHPLDRQATNNLKKIKGFDWLVGKFIEYGFERVDYVTHIGAGIRVGPKQMAKHYAMLRECCDILEVPEPELYVMQGGANAYTSGHNHPWSPSAPRLSFSCNSARRAPRPPSLPPCSPCSKRR